MPSLSAIRTLSVGTILGPEGEKYIEWHLQPEHLKVLLGRLTPQLNKIAQIVLHFGSTVSNINIFRFQQTRKNSKFLAHVTKFMMI